MARILLLGSDRERLNSIRSLLRRDGHAVFPLRAVESWRDVEGEVHPELIVAATNSSTHILEVHARAARGFPAPLLFVQHETDFYSDVHLDERLIDRIESPFMSEEFLGRVDALVRARRTILRTKSKGDGLSDSGGHRGLLREMGSKLAAILGTRVPRYEKPLGPYLEVAARIAEWADRRDVFEPGHAERVTSFAAMIAERLSLPDGEAQALLRAAMLHDIGKVALPVDVLRTEGPFGEDQRRLMRTHPERGAKLLRVLDNDDQVAECILYHHEQPDGAGYYKKAKDAIPRAAAILGVAEAYDAMTSTKLPARLRSETALDRLREQRGHKYDADCVDALVDALKPRKAMIPLAEPRR